MESQWIWPFELLDKIGEGGMGVVYRARYVGNNRQVAVKLIPNDITADATLLARFERELDVLKQMKHPNIVHCFGGSCESKQRFYAMEYVPGGTLSEHLIQKGALPWETAVDFAIQMCGALQYAHERGVVHRDIKPGNFLLTKSGQLKLSDFGLASIVSEGRLTAAGRTVGTILYMAPEQIRGVPVTHRADLYGLGCVIYEMLAGHPPYSGRNAAEVLQRHLKDAIPHVVRLVPRCPLELDELVCDLLSKDPEQRPSSATEVASRLNGILLPGRRTTPTVPDLFSSLSPKTVLIAPLKEIKRSASDASLRTVSPPRRVSTVVPWIVVGALLLVCVRLWSGWVQTTAHLQQAEQTCVELLEKAEPEIRVLGARSLAKFGPLRPSTIGKLRDATTSPIVDVRLASLQALARHAVECRALRPELIRIQKTDENSSVRTQAELTIAAIQQTSGPSSSTAFAFWAIVMTTIVGIGIAGWWVWKRMKPYVQ